MSNQQEAIMDEHRPIQITATCTACGSSFELPVVLASQPKGAAAESAPPPVNYYFAKLELEYDEFFALAVECKCGNSYYALKDEGFDNPVEPPGDDGSQVSLL